MIQASDPPQSGVLAAGDLLVGTISINSSTGALTFTPAANTELTYVPSAAGVLSPVNYDGSAQTLTPSLPASTKYAVIGVEINANPARPEVASNGVISLVKGADTATQLNTGTLIAANSPAVSSGKMRIADIAVWNNGGVYEFSDHTGSASQGVNWIDRRPWTRGFHDAYTNPSASYTTSSSSFVAVDSANFQRRVECSGAPLRIVVFGTFGWSGGSNEAVVTVAVDGSTSALIQEAYEFGTFMSGTLYEALAQLSPGSHLLTLMYKVVGGTAWLGATVGTGWSLREDVVPLANNGIALTRPDADPTASPDQTLAAQKDFAAVLCSYYLSMLAEGFNDDQALQLTQQLTLSYQRQLLQINSQRTPT